MDSEQGPSPSLSQIRVSAPSKVLISGCYLIIEPTYTGLVLSCSARLTTTLKISYNSDSSNGDIVCISPQMGDKKWIFKLKSDFEGESKKYTVSFDAETSSDSQFFSQAVLTTFFSLLPHLHTVSKEKMEEFDNLVSKLQTLEFTFIGDD